MASKNDCLDLSVNGPNKRKRGQGGNVEEKKSAADLLVEFLISKSISLDVINDSHFQTLVKSVVEHGQGSCLLLQNPIVIQRSLWKYEHKIKQYMQMVIKSWKTVGCTLMSYNLKGHQNQLVLGFYNPKGFIFVEVGSTEHDIKNAFKNLVPDSSYPWRDVTRYIRHDTCYHSECQYQSRDLYDSVFRFSSVAETKCIRQQVRMLWRDICRDSEWVRSLILKSDVLYEYIVSNLNGPLYNTLKEIGVEQIAGWKLASSYSRLVMVLKMEFNLKIWLSQHSERERSDLDRFFAEVPSIIDCNEFWNDVNELVQVLTPLFKIPHLLDTLIPTVGYIDVATDKTMELLKAYSEHKPQKYKPIWDCFDNWRLNSRDFVTYYLTPAYILMQEGEEVNFELEVFADMLWGLVDADKEVIDAEVEDYSIISSNPFAKLLISECEANHPIALWTKYGGKFPVLQKCAYKLLSQPSCCLCKQVEKHMSKLEGVDDNYIMRLNGLMMEDFEKMRDQIYLPIGIKSPGSSSAVLESDLLQ